MNDTYVYEPRVDEEQLAVCEDEKRITETEELIGALAAYCRSLESQVVGLRCKVNRLMAKEEDLPFPELHSDLYETFDHLAAYERFRHLLTELE